MWRGYVVGKRIDQEMVSRVQISSTESATEQHGELTEKIERKSPMKSRLLCLLSAKFTVERSPGQRVDDMAELWLLVKYRRDLR